MKSIKNSAFIKIKNHLSEMAMVSQVFDQFKENHSLPVKVTNPIDIALDEIINNIISYAYDDDKEHEIEIQFTISDGQLILRIKDDGRPFNPIDVKNADTTSDMNARAVGGLGIHLIKNMLDRMDYEFKNMKNCLTLYKNIRETK